jgi:hypothetical protein
MRAERPWDKDEATGSHDVPVIEGEYFVRCSNYKRKRQSLCGKPGYRIVSPCHRFTDRCLGHQIPPEAFHMGSM